MKKHGLILIAVALLIPTVWYAPLSATHDSSAVFSQYLGSAALIAMGIVQFLATRAKGIELIFGSMDRIYVLHKWLAVGALVAAALHDTIDADIDGVGVETILTDTAESFGEVGYYGLLILGVITVITFVPYHYWKWSHRFMGFFFAMASFHFIFIMKPFAMSDPVALYVLSFCLLGIFSYLYLLVPKNWLASRTKYQVTDLTQHENAIEVKLKPIGRGIKHTAGQFAFINFDEPNAKEIHPFTISSSPNPEREITFTIKALGAYTANLKHSLKNGTIANVSRAFGHFNLPQNKNTQIWVAAGIGITPFMAWAQTLDKNFSGNIKLYYCNYTIEKALYAEELKEIAENIDNFEIIFVSSKDEKRLTANRIKNELGSELGTAQVYFCGPKNMRESLKDDLYSLGLKKSAFYYEEFEIRSDIGVGKSVQWLLKRLGNKITAKYLAQQT